MSPLVPPPSQCRSLNTFGLQNTARYASRRTDGTQRLRTADCRVPNVLAPLFGREEDKKTGFRIVSSFQDLVSDNGIIIVSSRSVIFFIFDFFATWTVEHKH